MATVQPWPKRLPRTSAKASAVLTDIVTALENQRPALLTLASDTTSPSWQANARLELQCLRYELGVLEKAFAMA